MQPAIAPSAAAPAWLEPHLDLLAADPICGYRWDGTPGAEPTALAALALLAHGRHDAAIPALDWLRQRLDDRHGVGVSAAEREPGWPTGLAVLAWRFAHTVAAPHADEYSSSIERATRTILSWQGEALQPNEYVGHDCTLVGWSWIDGTHSWVEPTAMQVLALKRSLDHGDALKAGDARLATAAPRIQEAVRLLWDRQLPHGGWNYGNTFVLKQELRPHPLPSGLALLALADEPAGSQKADRSLEYLEQELGARTAAASLGYGLLALTAHGRRPAAADWWLQVAAQRTLLRHGSPWGLALVALAARPDAAPFVSAASGETA